MKGIVTKFDTGRKFGFIRPAGEQGDDIFFHQDDITSGLESLAPGCVVRFEVKEESKGPRATSIAVHKPAPVSPYAFFASGAVFLTAVSAGLLLMYAELPPGAAYLLGINGALFLLVGFDKGIAGGTSTRVPELVLYVFAAVGGSVGLLLGMHFFRHKTQKESFQFVMAIILVAQIALIRYCQLTFGWFHLPSLR